ncbi:DUF397 domain-containing protein [Streptomyces sp. NPDC048155]|uniref:DUF397 domain-containing protein n=1 Tax=Streptomyces sp. NPDC048155 TaxID=3154818 RepID=UPI0033C044FF
MSAPTWQRSSYCAQGEACAHVAATGTGAVLRTTPAAWSALVRALKDSRTQD